MFPPRGGEEGVASAVRRVLERAVYTTRNRVMCPTRAGDLAGASDFEPRSDVRRGHRPGYALSLDGLVVWTHRPDAMAGRGDGKPGISRRGRATARRTARVPWRPGCRCAARTSAVPVPHAVPGGGTRARRSSSCGSPRPRSAAPPEPAMPRCPGVAVPRRPSPHGSSAPRSSGRSAASSCRGAACTKPAGEADVRRFPVAHRFSPGTVRVGGQRFSGLRGSEGPGEPDGPRGRRAEGGARVVTDGETSGPRAPEGHRTEAILILAVASPGGLGR